MRSALVLSAVVLLAACQERIGLAPVSEARSQRESMPAMYRVQRYDTLYSIAFRYDQDYHAIARMNGLYSPYSLRVGQVIYLKTPQIQYKPRYVSYRATLPITRHRKPMTTSSRLRWPTERKQIAAYFSPEKGRKGIDILGRSGDAIYASSEGVVAYAGDGLGGYGNLVIIKHNDKVLTAYAHNARIFVKEGQHVSSGQKIATMGRLDRQHYGVHYEVREWGKPVNPLLKIS